MALEAKRGRGERVGQIPFGHRLSDDGIHVEVDAAEQEAITRVRALRSAGMTLQGIADQLEDEGVPARGSRWYAMTVRRIVNGSRVKQTPPSLR